jgi:hypothetical protein
MTNVRMLQYDGHIEFFFCDYDEGHGELFPIFVFGQDLTKFWSPRLISKNHRLLIISENGMEEQVTVGREAYGYKLYDEGVRLDTIQLSIFLDIAK